MNELIIDRMRKWQIQTIAIITIILIIGIITMATVYDRRIIESKESHGRVGRSDEDFVVLRNREDLQKANKWANTYLTIKPDERINGRITFEAEVELHKVRNHIDSVTSSKGEYSTYCYATTCSDILIVQDGTVEDAIYIVVMKILNVTQAFNETSFSYEFTTVSSSEGQTIFDICVTSITFIIAIVAITFFFVYNIRKKKFNLYFWCNAILSIGCLILINPSVFIKIVSNNYWIELLDSVFNEIYIFIMILWSFFQIDHLNLLGINKEYPVRQWIFRSITLISYFISESVYIHGH